MAQRILFALTLVGSALLGQQEEHLPLDVVLPPAHRLTAAEGPTIIAWNVLGDSKTRQLLQSGFPTILHYRLELWRKGGVFGDSPERNREWEMLVEYEPASQLYRVHERFGTVVTDLGQGTSLAEAEALIDRPQIVSLGPSRPGQRYYYSAHLEVNSLTGNDLDETLRWLKGDAAPAVQGKNNPLTALGQGILTLLSRVLGRKLTYDLNSALFTAG